ncbi:hypothetical protein, partial [Corallococcus sicarius]
MAEVARSHRTCGACGRRHGPETACDTLVPEAGDGVAGAVAEPAVAPVEEVDPLVGTRMGSFRL